MTDDQLNKAVEFLVQQRPHDHRFTGYSDRRAAYAYEIRSHLQLQAALKMAGLVDSIATEAAPPAEDILSCVVPGCGWAGHEGVRNTGMHGVRYCPNCGSSDFVRAAA